MMDSPIIKLCTTLLSFSLMPGGQHVTNQDLCIHTVMLYAGSGPDPLRHAWKVSAQHSTTAHTVSACSSNFF